MQYFLNPTGIPAPLRPRGDGMITLLYPTKQIGPVSCPPNPTLYKTPYHGPGHPAAWEVEIASDSDGKDIVFKSMVLDKEDRMTVSTGQGRFHRGTERLTQNYPPDLHTFAVSAREAAMENGLPGVTGTSPLMYQSASK